MHDYRTLTRLAELRRDELLREAEHDRLVGQLKAARIPRESARRRAARGLMRLGYWIDGAALRELPARPG